MRPASINGAAGGLPGGLEGSMGTCAPSNPYSPSARNRFFVIMPLIFLAVGLYFISRPVYHYCCWKVNELKGRVMWNDWQRGAGGRVESIASKSEPAVWLSVPGVGLNTLVLNGADKESLYRYPCLESNIGMNESGMKLILGHRDMHFRKLKDIAIGFKIGLELPGNKQRAYRVVETEIVAAGKVLQRVNRMTDEDWLVLMTCYPFEYTGPAPRRFLVWARPVEKIKSASGGPPGGQNLFEKRFQHLQKLLLVGQFTNCFDTSLRRAHLQSKGNK